MGKATFGRRHQLWLQEHTAWDTDINSTALIYAKIWPNLLSSGQLQKQKSWANVSVALAKEDEAFQECARANGCCLPPAAAATESLLPQ